MNDLVKEMFQNGRNLLSGRITKEQFWKRQKEHEELARTKQLKFNLGGKENGKETSKEK